jgi:hypothetical protein
LADGNRKREVVMEGIQQRTLSVIIIHGIGDQPRAYHLPLAERIKARFAALSGMSAGEVEQTIRFRAVDWSNIGRQEQQDLLNRYYPPPYRRYAITDLYPLRQVLVTGFDDALLYLSEYWHQQVKNQLRQAIFEEGRWLQQQYSRGPRFVSIVAHSLGSVIAYDVCYDFFTETSQFFRDSNSSPSGVQPPEIVELDLELSNLFTMGSPLAIWSLTHDPSKTWYRDRPVGVRLGGVWYNFYSPWDPIALPLAPIYPVLAEEGVLRDFRVWSGLNAHSGYWACRSVVQRIAERLWVDYQDFVGYE